MTFQTDVCETYGCDKTGYYKTVLFKCLYLHVVPVAKIIHAIYPGFFIEDYELLMRISTAESPDEIHFMVTDFLYERPPRGFFRGLLKVRISPERLVKFARSVMKKPIG